MRFPLVSEAMKIRNVVHPGLCSLIAEDEPAGPRGIDVSRLRRILSFLQDMAGESELRCIAGWMVQPAPGAGRGRWQLRAAPVTATMISKITAIPR